MRHWIYACIGALALVGCNGDDSEPRIAPPFEEGQGQEAHGSKAYPDGPYGVSPGSVIANYKFVGYVNAMVSQTLAEIQLAEFYNPTGDGLYEEGGIFPVGQAKPKALLIDIASVWCGPCNYEADQVLPGLYTKYKPMNGEFLLQLFDGPTPGVAAKQNSLTSWVNKYDVDYPATLDPASKLGALFEADAFPTNMIIDTRTMKIVEVIAGAPEPGSSFWKLYEKVLAGTAP